MLPRELPYAGIVFHLAPAKGGNALVPRGQEISIPAGVRRLYVLAASAAGDQNVVFRVGNETIECNDSELEWFYRTVGQSSVEAD